MQPLQSSGSFCNCSGHFFVADDVGNDGAPAFLQDAEDFVEELPFGVRFDEIKHAIGNDHVDRITGNQWMFHAQFLGEFIGRQK